MDVWGFLSQLPCICRMWLFCPLICGCIMDPNLLHSAQCEFVFTLACDYHLLNFSAVGSVLVLTCCVFLFWRKCWWEKQKGEWKLVININKSQVEGTFCIKSHFLHVDVQKKLNSFSPVCLVQFIDGVARSQIIFIIMNY